MRMHGFGALTLASGGSIPNAFKAAYVGPASGGSTVIGNPAGTGGLMTTTFSEEGPIATYDDLRDGVRYGWPLMFALGWAGSYLFWRWQWKRTGKLSGLRGTPAQHRQKAREWLDMANHAVRAGNERGAIAYASAAMDNAMWAGEEQIRREAQQIIDNPRGVDPFAGLGKLRARGSRNCKIVRMPSGRRRMCWDSAGKITSNTAA